MRERHSQQLKRFDSFEIDGDHFGPRVAVAGPERARAPESGASARADGDPGAAMAC
jgi:hypothetical protein